MEPLSPLLFWYEKTPPDALGGVFSYRWANFEPRHSDDTREPWTIGFGPASVRQTDAMSSKSEADGLYQQGLKEDYLYLFL